MGSRHVSEHVPRGRTCGSVQTLSKRQSFKKFFKNFLHIFIFFFFLLLHPCYIRREDLKKKNKKILHDFTQELNMISCHSLNTVKKKYHAPSTPELHHRSVVHRPKHAIVLLVKKIMDIKQICYFFNWVIFFFLWIWSSLCL
jgi:hypothetical protein